LLKRQSKTDSSQPKGPPRILVVDDNPDAARLLGKLFRRVGYEVAEVSDHQVALITMMNEPAPISAVIASFSTSGNGSCLKLLDAVRHTPEARVNTQRVVLILDSTRQQMFSWQSGADEIILRPYRAEDLLAAVGDVIERADADRPAYRRQMIDRIREQSAGPQEPVEPTIGAAHFN
jgi:DNA-binding response OmpR family regulator